MSAGASPTSIGAFFDVDAADCESSVVQFVPFNVYLSAVLGTDAAGSGITGANFRVDGLTDLVLSIVPIPAASAAVGNPTTGDGAIAFPMCMTGDGPRKVVLLYTITCLATEPVAPRIVSVDNITRPCDSGCCRFAPRVALCDAPVYTYFYVLGGQALLNSGSCTVGVQPASWSAVRSLFNGYSNRALHPPDAEIGRW
jgi:hypothetical protein